MNGDIKSFYRDQKIAAQNFCGFVEAPEDIEKAILELVGRFEWISGAQLIKMLESWFPSYEVSRKLQHLVFTDKVVDDFRNGCRLPKVDEKIWHF